MVALKTSTRTVGEVTVGVFVEVGAAGVRAHAAAKRRTVTTEDTEDTELFLQHKTRDRVAINEMRDISHPRNRPIRVSDLKNRRRFPCSIAVSTLVTFDPI